MTTKLSSARARFTRPVAALGTAALAFAGLAGPAFAVADDPASSDEQIEQSHTPAGDDAPGPEDDGTPGGAGDGADSGGQGEGGQAAGDLTDGTGEDAGGDNTGSDPANETNADDGAPEESAPEGSGPEESDPEEGDPGEPAESFAPLAATAAATQKTVDLVGVNDFHGRIDAGRDLAGGDEGAAVRLAAAVEAARSANPGTLFVGAGDLYSASTFTSMAGDDIPTTDVFNAMGLDVSAVGNHEFDHGFPNLQERRAGNGKYAGHAIDWPYLGANVYEAGTSNPVLPEYVVLDADGIDIAFIGVVTQETPSLVTPDGIAGLEFGDPTDAIKQVINDYSEVRDADAIVILIHDGAVDAKAVSDTNTHFGKFVADMAGLENVAGIFSGHTHTDYTVDVAATGTGIDTMPVIQTGSFGDFLGRISLTFDVADDGTATLTGASSALTKLSDVTPPAAGNTVVDAVRRIVADAVEKAEATGAEVIGEASGDLLRATHTDPETGNKAENRGGESTISNLIADAQLWAVHDQDSQPVLPVIAFMNPGGVRTDIPQGPVTYKQVADVQPFANTLDTFDLTGAQIKQVLEEQWQPDGASRPFLKLGVNAEFFYTYDPTAPRGERIQSMLLDGNPINPGATYRVVTNNFLSSGGDNFTTLGEGAGYTDTGIVDLEAFVDYFREHSVVEPDYAQRAVGVHWVTGADEQYQEGDVVEIDLSSLVFANNEPKPTRVSALLVNPVTGTESSRGHFAVDTDVVSGSDEMGRASLRFKVPRHEEIEDEAAAWELRITDSTGFLALPLELAVRSGPVVVDLVGLNDFHGRIDAGRTPIRNADGDVVGFEDEGAAVRLAAAVEQARSDNPDTFFVGAGDLYSASTFTSMAGNDIPTTDVFNAMGLDTSAVGNHEFDRGYQDLLDRLEGNGEYAGHAIEWPYLGANVYIKGTTRPALPEFLVLPTGGFDIAFIGLVTQETPSLVTPDGIAGLEFGDPAEAVERVIASNTEVQDADAVIVLTHDGGVNGAAVSDTSTHFGAFAAEMAARGDIAGIFSGHTHTVYEVDLPTTSTTVGEMPVIQTGSFGDNLGYISLTFDADGQATLVSAVSDMMALGGVVPPPEGDSDVVDEVRDIVAAAVEAADEIGSVIIGEAGADLNRAVHTDPETGNPAENRGGESTISNLIADAQLWAVHEQAATDNLPVIAFMNPGGVRTDIPQGPVSYKQVADVQPFANTLDTFDLTGAQIKQVLEEQWQPDGASRPFLKLGVNAEFFYTYDPEAPRGERISAMFLDGEPIAMDGTYRVVTNNFLAAGGDNFLTLGEGAAYADTGIVDLQAFVDYFESRDVVQPDFAQRAVGVHWVTDENAAYAEAEEFEINLSSLAFSTNEPKPAEFTVLLVDPGTEDTIELGTIDVDATVVNTNDETGRATAAFAIPQIPGLASGTWALAFFDDLGHTAFAVDITLQGEGAGPAPGGEDLSETGVEITGMLVASGILLAIGGVTLAVRRRELMR